MLEKSFAMHADNVTYDLEDSVAPHMKPEARSNLRSILNKPRPSGIKEMCVRINSVDTGLALDDLTEVLKGEHLDAIMVPKCESAADLHFVTDVIRHLSPARHPSDPSKRSGKTRANPHNRPHRVRTSSPKPAIHLRRITLPIRPRLRRRGLCKRHVPYTHALADRVSLRPVRDCNGCSRR
jgi:hypothetical protein